MAAHVTAMVIVRVEPSNVATALVYPVAVGYAILGVVSVGHVGRITIALMRTLDVPGWARVDRDAR